MIPDREVRPELLAGDEIATASVDAGKTTSSRLRTASGGIPLLAVITKGYVPAVSEAGIPLMLPLVVLKTSPEGSAPDMLN